MRKIDEDKKANEKAAKTINFEKPVLEAIEERSRKTGMNESKLVNWICKEGLMNKIKFYNDMALFHAQEQAKYEFLRNKEVEKQQIRIELR